MKYALTLAAAAVAALTLAAPSQASPHVVTRPAFDRIELGQSKAHVEAVFGSHGSLVSHGSTRDGERLWKFYGNDDGSVIAVGYFKPAGTTRYLFVDKQWCTGNLTVGNLSCS